MAIIDTTDRQMWIGAMGPRDPILPPVPGPGEPPPDPDRDPGEDGPITPEPPVPVEPPPILPV